MYETIPMMELCRQNGWKYIFSHKKSQQYYADEEYEMLPLEEKQTVNGIGKEKGEARYYNHIEELAEKSEKMNVYEYICEKKVRGKETQVHFQWVTNIELTPENLKEMIHAGRGRWKIENEGFNNQKNGLYNIQHLNSRNNTAMKNHYLLTQIADILM